MSHQSTTPSGDANRTARELLAAEYEREGIEFVPNAIRTDPILTTAEARAVRAIVAALARNAEQDRLIADITNAAADAAIKQRDITAALAAENKALREAFGNLIGDPTDPNIGWRGRSSGIEMFACEHCRAEHLDCTMIPHSAECPVPPAIALARTLANGDAA